MKEIRFNPKKVFINGSYGSSRGIRCDTKEKASTFLDWLIKYLKKDFGYTLVWGDNDLVEAGRPFYEGPKTTYHISSRDGKLRYGSGNSDVETLLYEEVLLGETIAAPSTSTIDKNKVFPNHDFRDSVSVHCDTEDKAKSYINWLVDHFKAAGKPLKWSCGSDIANKKGNITEYRWCYYSGKTCYSVTPTGRVVYAPLGNNILTKEFPYDKNSFIR